ncbi:MAG: fibronectin type III domain-containing protein, partial [Thermoplasmata archaeon]|nr:fibronectin type III domain-containing protein [Thermoplasmata archaeon]
IQAHLGEAVNGDLVVPINVSLGRAGKMKLHNVVIQFYKLVQPTNLAATAIPGGSAIKLTWDDHTSKGDDISKMAIEMWNGTGWEEVTKVAKNAEEYIVSGLEDGQSYSFRILAFDGGVQRYSEPSDVAIGVPGDTKPPAKITGIVAIEDRDLMGINVSWDPSDDDVVNYEVWSNKTGTWAVLANVSAPIIYYVDTDVDDGPRYYYKVRAWDEVPLVGEFSRIVFGVLYDLTPPMIPENLQVHIVPVGRALELTWDLNDDDTVAYSIVSNKTGQWLEMALVDRSEDSYVDTGLTDGTRYYFRLRAKDESNNFSNHTAVASGVPVDSEPPMAPMGLEANPRSVGNILRLTWILNDDDTMAYNIYIFDTGASEWEFVTNVAGDVNQYEVGDLENGVTYRIRIKAADLAERESDWSNEATGIPTDTHPPNIPQGLEAELDPNGGAVNLSWDPNNDDTVAYNVLEWSGSAWIEIATVTHPLTWQYLDGLTNNQPYAYVVRAVDEADNESPNSQRVDVIPKDTVKPEPPVFVDMPPVTNQKDQVLTGYSDPHATIITYLNLYPQDPVICDDEGNFKVTVRLKNGPNEVFAEAVDDAGTSDPSIRHTIRVDLDGPQVESTEPADGSKDLGRLNFTWEVYFNEEVRMDSIKAYLTKGRVAHADLVANIDLPTNIIPVLKEYNNVRSIATFEVMEDLQSGSTYSILIYEVEDMAGNPLDHPNNAFSFYIETSTTGGGGGGGGGDEGLGSIALYAGVGIAII